MKIKRDFGILLLIIGTIIISSNSIITGNVTGNSSQNVTSLFGVIAFIFGIFFIFSASLEERAEERKNYGSIADILLQGQREKFYKLGIKRQKVYETSYAKHLKKSKKRKEKPYSLKSVGEAVELGRLPEYLSGKRLIFDTSLRGGTYDKHTQFLGTKTDEKEFLKRTGNRAQYSPEFNLDQVHRFEEYVARKGKGYSVEGKDKKVRVYGAAHSKHGGPPGASNHRFTRYIAVELQERPDGIHIHGYPVSDSEILNKYK